MANPKPSIPSGLPESLANLKPSQDPKHTNEQRRETQSPAPKVKPSSRPLQAVAPRVRSTNRGK